ncbi:MAG: PilZ domain-containing protein [Acidobacteria bacterium]|nr:PilZ domain-containing protein [Acidobacteriota bacterium]
MAAIAAGVPPFLKMRRWTRYDLDVPIRVIAKMPAKVKIVSGRGRDISEGGMLVFAGIELRVDEIVEVEFTPPFGGPLRVSASVRNRSGYYYGLEFLCDTEESRTAAKRLGQVLRSAAAAQ